MGLFFFFLLYFYVGKGGGGDYTSGLGWGAGEVLLHNGRTCNGCITKRIWHLQYKFSIHEKFFIFRKTTKNIGIFIILIFYHRAVVKLYDTFVEFFKHHFVMQPLQNPPLCSRAYPGIMGRALGMMRLVRMQRAVFIKIAEK